MPKFPSSIAGVAVLAATSLLKAGDPMASPEIMIFADGEQPPEELRDENRVFQGIPGIDSGPGGRLWATWYGGGYGEDENNVVMVATSGNDGESWSDLRVIVSTDNPVRSFDPVLWTDPLGRLWLLWGQAIAHGIHAQTWGMITENPDDPHPTWSEPFNIGPGVMMNKPTVTEAGEWVFPISDWEGRRLRTEGAATAQALVSTDEGRSFEVRGAAYVPVEHRQYDEHMFVEREDGSLWMWVRTLYGIGESISTDDGVAWPEVTPSEVEHSTARFFIRRLQSGNLLLVKHGAIDERIGRRNLTAFVSRDDGETWEGGLVLEDRQCSYPDGFQAEDARIYIIYDRRRRDDKQIKMAVFTEDDALAGRQVSDQMRTRVLVNRAFGLHPRSVENIAFDPNQDGAETLPGRPAEWQVQSEGSVESFTLGTLIFTNRRYLLAQLPEKLEGSRFIRAPLGETVAVSKEAGVVYVVTPTLGRNDHSLHDQLIAEGFEKVAIPEFLLFVHGAGAANVCTVYQKEVHQDELLALGRWGVVVIPPP